MNPAVFHPFAATPAAGRASAPPTLSGTTGQPTLRDAEPGAFARELLAQQSHDVAETMRETTLSGAPASAPVPPPAPAAAPAAPHAAPTPPPPATDAAAAAPDAAGDDATEAGADTADAASGPADPPAAPAGPATRSRLPRATAERWQRGAATADAGQAAVDPSTDGRAEAGDATAATGEPALPACEAAPGALLPSQLPAEALHHALRPQAARAGDAADTPTVGPRDDAADAVDASTGARAQALTPSLSELTGSAARSAASAQADATRSALAASTRDTDAASSASAADAALARSDALAGTLAAGGGLANAAAALLTPANGLSPFVAELTRAAQALSPQPSTPALSAEAERHIHTPVMSPEFPSRVSTELAVLARDGVQEARLHVSPEALGPIAVQIRLDGSAAQVNLAADNAQTRQVLEQSMPTLAAALRESGLTLTGGGVFQQSPQSGRDGSPDDGRRSSPGAANGRAGAPDGADGTALQATATPRRARLPGQVDLYA